MRHRLASIFSVLLSISLASIALAESSGAVLTASSSAAYVAPTRMAGNIDSWIALAIVITSVITAWAINYSAPKVRVFGTLLAALGCFTVAAWFLIYVVNTGFLENPKPNQTPLDSAKPALLWIQAIIALVAGLFLILVAVRQSKSQEALILTAANEPQRYGRVSRLLHWTTAGLFLTLIPMGIFTSIIPEQTEYRNAYYVVHKTLGVTALLLLVIRLVWNRISQRPALDSTLTSRERQLARFAHFMLYMMMLALPVTGFMMTSLHGYPTYFFAWELAPLWPQSDSYILWGAMHKYLLPYLLYIVLGAHILGTMKHHYIDKKANAFKRMGG